MFSLSSFQTSIATIPKALKVSQLKILSLFYSFFYFHYMIHKHRIWCCYPEGSAVNPSVPGSLPRCHLLTSFIHTHWLPFSAALEQSFAACRWAFPRTPSLLELLRWLRTLCNLLPLGRPPRAQWARWCGLSRLIEADHSTRSGRRLVDGISAGKQSLVSRSTSILQSHALPICPVSSHAVVRLAWPFPHKQMVLGSNRMIGGGRELMFFCRLSSTESSPYCMHQSFSLPGSRVLLMFSRQLANSFLSSSTCFLSLREASY